MSEEEINIAIAEQCGFTDIMWPTGFHQQMSDEKSKHSGGRWRFQIPNYCNDLNDMHEAEKQLNTVTQWKTYKKHLLTITDPVCATASQRANAFLKTINKWEKS
jgi:hypothetical protein